MNRNFNNLFYIVWAGAFNDNFFKILLLTIISQKYSGGEESFLISLAGAILVLPYILLAPIAGWLADRFAKSSITLFTRTLEPLLIILGSYFLFNSNIFGLMVVLCGFGTQSTLFSPAKYGMIAEITPSEKLTKANGFIELSTFLGILLGTAVGSQIQSIADNAIVASIIILGSVTLTAIYAATRLEKTPTQNPELKLSWDLLTTVKDNLKEIKKHKDLLKVTIASSWFWLIGAFSQLAIFILPSEIPNIDESGTGFIITAIIFGIGLGSTLVGIIPQKYLTKVFTYSGLTLASTAFLIGICAVNLITTILIFFSMGIAAGFYIVPLNALFQELSPVKKRGNYLAAFNMLSNLAILIASMSLWLFNSWLGIPLKVLFMLIGVATIFITKFCKINDHKLSD